MIVQCDKCTTRFRIADDKVTPNGVKVRCSRCAHVFVVSSDAAGSGAQTSDKPDNPVMSALAESTVSSLSADRPTAPNAAPGGPPRPPPGAETSSTAAVAAALGFAGGTGLDGPAGLRRSSDLFNDPVTDQTQRLDALSGGSSDFADLDEAFRRALADSKDLPGSSVDSIVQTPLAPLEVPSSGINISNFEPLNPGEPNSDGLGLGNTPTRAYAEEGDTGALLGALYEHGPKSSPAMTRFPPPASEPPAPPRPKPQTDFPPPATGSFSPSPFGTGDADGGDIPGLLALADDDPFANIDIQAPPSSGGIISDPRGPPLLSPHSLRAPEPLPVESEPLAKLELDQQPRMPDLREARAPEPTAVVRSYTPPPPPDPEAPPSEGRWPTLAGILVGLSILVFLLPDLGQRAVEAVLPPGWGVEWAGAVAAPTPVQVNRARVAAYPTKRGEDVLVVAGDALNRTEGPLAGVEVVVAVFEGPKQVDERRGLVNVVLTEGQLAALQGPNELAAAYEDALRAHGNRGVVLPPGIERPFMVVFPKVPSNAADLRYRVSFVVP